MPQLNRTCPDFLLDAAMALMAEKGFAATSMRQLASRAGLLPGSLYHYVSSKQDILADVLVTIVDRRLEDWHQGSHSRDLEGYVRFLLARQRSHPGEEVLLRYEIRHLDPASQAWVEQSMQKLKEPIHSLIEQGQRSGRFSISDVRGASDALMALLQASEPMRSLPVDDAWIESRMLTMSFGMLGLRVADAPAEQP